MQAARDELLELYSRLDEELAALQSACRTCGRCCDFSTHENVLYASRLEREVLRLAGTPPADAPPGVCPYLREGKCTARTERTLGCRTHFCDRHAAAVGRDLYEKYRRRIAAISRAHGIPWDYRPVLDELPPAE